MDIKKIAAGLAAAGLVVSSPVSASNLSQAEKLRRLDIMLMVTGLRCRTSADNFQPEYHRFSANHLAELNAAAATLQRELASRYGAAGAARALDKMSVQMANEYGQGHPWLNCHQLKQVAGTLANMRGAAPLAEAAEDLLDDNAHNLAWMG